MRLRVKMGQLSIDQSREERVVLHLGSLHDLPESKYDPNGYKRTANGISAATGIAYTTVAPLLKQMMQEGILELHDVQYRTDAGQGHVYAYVYVLTPDGRALYDEIRRRLE